MSDPRTDVPPPAELLGDAAAVPEAPPAGLGHVPVAVNREHSEHLIVNFGPQHPSMHGVLRILGELDGEQVVRGEVNIGYLHRGIEKLAESRRYDAVGTLLDRGDYISGIHGELAFAMAVEQIAGIEVPERALWLRTLLGEINRISSHLLWYGPMGLDAGAMGQFLYAIRDREMLLDILEAITGARMMFNYVRPGGVLRDLPAGVDAKIRAFCDHFEKMLPEHDDLLGGNEIFQYRTKGVGVVSRDTALAYALTGANLRASGVNFDLRRDRPYAAYDKVDFDVPIAEEGDIFARYVVRMEEMRQALRIIRQCMEGIPEGLHTAKVAKVLRPPAGEAYAAVESPRGELGMHVVSDGTDRPYRVRYRPPTFYSLQAIEGLIPGNLLADMIVIAGSFDIVLGEIDR